MKFNNKNVVIGKNVFLGKNVQIGDNSVIYDNVCIGDNTIISNDCIIGEPLNNYYTDKNYRNPKTIIGRDSLIRSHTIIYANSTFNKGLNAGHRVTIRENTTIGENCMIGSFTDIQGFCIIGNYSRFHSHVCIGQNSTIGNFVFIYPYVTLTNDPTPPSNNIQGVTINDYCQISTSSVLLPKSEIGESSLVAANSTVGGVYPPDSFISGSPAKKVGTLSKMPFFNNENKRHYPWPFNFDRGMPWRNIGYNNWLKSQK